MLTEVNVWKNRRFENLICPSHKYKVNIKEIHILYYKLINKCVEAEVADRSRLLVFCKKTVLKNLAKFTEKHLCWSLFLITLQTFRLLFSCEFCESFNNTFLIEHLWGLFLSSAPIRKLHKFKVLLDFRNTLAYYKLFESSCFLEFWKFYAKNRHYFLSSTIYLPKTH